MSKQKSIDDIFGELRVTEPYLSDDGFSSAVMLRLPEAAELPLWVKNLILLAATAFGSALVTWQLPLEKLTTLLATQTVLLSTQTALLSIQTLTLPVFAGAAAVIYLLSYGAIWGVQQDII